MAVELATDGIVAGVMGLSHDTTPMQEEKAFQLGREIAKAGLIMLTGATTGLPHHAAMGAKKEGGIVIGISPASNPREHVEMMGKPTDNHDFIVYTGLGFMGRNSINIKTSDIIFILAGHIGTLNEFTHAFVEKKPVAVLTGTGGIADKLEEIVSVLGAEDRTIIYDSSPEELVKKALSAFGGKNGKT
ncbi:hypothetical protein D6764_03355 [Candidatus Woesearchaeota archaeon]|nr:MAG: hypothetical protein D6764_03355 [Candidatus Woesearchaeota archaeon]